MSTDASPRRPNGPDTHRSVGVAEERCPFCGAPLSRAEFRAIQAKIAEEERARIAKVEQALKDRFTREKAHAETQAKAAIEKARKESAARELAVRQEATKTANAAVAPKIDAAVNAERAKHFAEKLKLEEQLGEMQRQLQKKTAHELGEPAEVDLYEALRKEFPGETSRVSKGVKGPDIIVKIAHNGVVAGSIVIDCKNQKRWSNTFTKKLRDDQIAEGADFCILSTNVLPAGEQQICLRDHVLVSAPARVRVLVHLLRRHVLANHTLKRSSEGRSEKGDRLLAYMVSAPGRDLLDGIIKLTGDMADLDVKETASHQVTWKKRSELIRGIQTAHGEFSAAISRIVGGSEASP